MYAFSEQPRNSRIKASGGAENSRNCNFSHIRFLNVPSPHRRPPGPPGGSGGLTLLLLILGDLRHEGTGHQNQDREDACEQE